MPKEKIKPPKQTRTELLDRVQSQLSKMKRSESERELMSYFTSADLLGIAEALEKGIRNDIAV